MIQPTIVQIEAAKLRMITDRRLGKTTPDWIKKIALAQSRKV